jgi:hypothetical protein
VNKKNKKNVLVRLYRGDISLPKTFWISSIALAIIGMFTSYITSFFIKTPGSLLIYLFFHYIIFMIFQLFILRAIWNACKKHKGLLIWRILSRIYAIFMFIVIILVILSIAFEATVIITAVNNTPYLKDKTLSVKINNYLLNQNLPKKISNGISLENIRDNKRDIVYTYKNTSLDEELNIDALDNGFCKSILNAKQYKKIIIKAYDQNNMLIQEDEITYNKCLSMINS